MKLSSNIPKLYLANFLTGLIFWYGIEKLFMKDIGITVTGIGIATAVALGVTLLLDVPAGMLADRWSRKYVLLISTIALLLASVVMGTSHGLGMYLIGELFYGIYIITTGGTFQALIYDSLYELGEAKQYSRINGRAYALFLAGTGVGNILSGFIAHRFGLSTTYLLSVIPCVINAGLILSIREPLFHKPEHTERIIESLRGIFRVITSSQLMRSLVFVFSTLTIVELFKSEFSQLYMLRYVSSAQLLGLLWAGYSFTWAFGSLIAHRFHAKIHELMIATVAPLLIMAFIDSWVSLIFFMLQAVASAALMNQIETRVQDATPSHLRASVFSTLATIGRAISIPASFLLGWIISHYNAFSAVRVVAIIAAVVLLYWMVVGRRRLIRFELKQEVVG